MESLGLAGQANTCTSPPCLISSKYDFPSFPFFLARVVIRKFSSNRPLYILPSHVAMSSGGMGLDPNGTSSIVSVAEAVAGAPAASAFSAFFSESATILITEGLIPDGGTGPPVAPASAPAAASRIFASSAAFLLESHAPHSERDVVQSLQPPNF